MREIHSVGILLVEEEGTFLLQHRDNRADIFYPGKIGLFGGQIDDGETPECAVVREIKEELSINIVNPKLISILNLIFIEKSIKRRRYFYVYTINQSLARSIRLQEGQAILKLKKKDFVECEKFVPYDLAFIIDYIFGE